jgi:DNA-directed RNA polymerase II subunit RPB1
MEEIRAILKMYGLAVNYRHISALADVMTYRGKLMSITRHGVNRSDKGPLMRSSFEETVDILYDAAAFGLADDMNGVTQVFFFFFFLKNAASVARVIVIIFVYLFNIFIFSRR